jgi:hypothetical protein
LRKTCIAAYLLLCLFISACLVRGIYAASTEVAVDPPVSTVNVGDVFSMNLTVTNVVNLTAWQMNIYYLKALLNCTDVAEGPFLRTGGETYFGQNITNNYNSTHGRILAYSTLLGITSANGSGAIVTITFKAMSGGSTALALGNTQLADEKVPPQQIPHQDFGGTVIVTGGLTGDINSDGTVDIFDAILLAASYGSSLGDPNWNPNTDLNNDSTVDIFDAILLAGNFGRTT